MSYLLNSTPHFYSPPKQLILLTHRYSDPSLIQYFAGRLLILPSPLLGMTHLIVNFIMS